MNAFLPSYIRAFLISSRTHFFLTSTSFSIDQPCVSLAPHCRHDGSSYSKPVYSCFSSCSSEAWPSCHYSRPPLSALCSLIRDASSWRAPLHSRQREAQVWSLYGSEAWLFHRKYSRFAEGTQSNRSIGPQESHSRGQEFAVHGSQTQ